jgi:formate/nitrite transporter FocA (FNT family)
MLAGLKRNSICEKDEQSTVLNKVAKQLVKPLSKQRETTRARRRGISSAGRAGIFIGIGAVVILIGGLIGGANFVSTIGGIIFLTGLVMLVIALIRGK